MVRCLPSKWRNGIQDPLEERAVIVHPTLPNSFPGTETKRTVHFRPASLFSNLSLTSPEDLLPPADPQETLVTDIRASLSPAEMVERKLIALLRSAAIPISHVQMLSTGLSRR
jgi:hypothetical protein